LRSSGSDQRRAISEQEAGKNLAQWAQRRTDSREITKWLRSFAALRMTTAVHSRIFENRLIEMAKSLGLSAFGVGEFGFFGDVGGGFEVEMVAVGVDKGHVPHGVADEGFAGLDTAGFEFVVEGDGVFAHEPEGDTFTEFFFWDAALEIFLKHQGGAA
jgi:hypothetical protein